MSAFEDFVVQELPRRPVMLTAELCGGYTGDPNDLGAPIIIQNSPKGTFYLRGSDNVLWKKHTASVGSWGEVGSGGGGGGGVTIYATEALLLADTPADGTLGYAEDVDRYRYRRNGVWDLQANLSAMTNNIVFPIDYATGVDPDPGVIFRSTAEVTAYLASKGQTYFKTIMGCFDALPDICQYGVSFSLQPGVHRPRVGEVGGAFYFRPFGSRRVPVLLGSAQFVIGAAVPTAAASWEVLVAGQTCLTATSSNPSNGLEVALTFAGTPFTPSALKGYFARIETPTPQHIVIRDNTADTLYLGSTYGTSPVGVNVVVVSPATIIRNSLDDIAPAYSTMFTFSSENCWLPSISTRVSFDTVRLDQFTTTGFSGPIEIVGGLRMTLTRVLEDAARLKDLGFAATTGHYFLTNGFSITPARVALTSCSVRGLRLAAVPAIGSTCISINASGPPVVAMGSLSMVSSFFGGFQSASNPIRAVGCEITVSSLCCDNFQTSGIEFTSCRVTSIASGSPKNFLRNFSSTAWRLVNCKCGTFGNMALETMGTFPLYVIGETEVTFDSIYAGALGGLTSYIIYVSGPKAHVKVARIYATTTNVNGDLSLGNLLVGFIADFKKRWEFRDSKADWGTLYNAVRALRVGDFAPPVTPTNLTIRYTAAGTTLEYHSPSDPAGAYGPPVNVGAGGRFTLLAANAAEFIVVDVVGSLLPGSDTTIFPTLVMRSLNFAGDQVFFSNSG